MLGATILLVDDNEVLIGQAAAYLTQRGLKVISHHSPFGVGVLLLRHRPDLVVLDVPHRPSPSSARDGDDVVAQGAIDSPATADSNDGAQRGATQWRRTPTRAALERRARWLARPAARRRADDAIICRTSRAWRSGELARTRVDGRSRCWLSAAWDPRARARDAALHGRVSRRRQADAGRARVRSRSRPTARACSFRGATRGCTFCCGRSASCRRWRGPNARSIRRWWAASCSIAAKRSCARSRGCDRRRKSSTRPTSSTAITGPCARPG